MQSVVSRDSRVVRKTLNYDSDIISYKLKGCPKSQGTCHLIEVIDGQSFKIMFYNNYLLIIKLIDELTEIINIL
jgi:hypothetical protein